MTILEIRDNGGIENKDNGGSVDRYTVVFDLIGTTCGCYYEALAMSKNPYRGVGQHCTAATGDHLGKEISFSDLPKECQDFTKEILKICDDNCSDCGDELDLIDGYWTCYFCDLVPAKEA